MNNNCRCVVLSDKEIFRELHSIFWGAPPRLHWMTFLLDTTHTRSVSHARQYSETATNHRWGGASRRNHCYPRKQDTSSSLLLEGSSGHGAALDFLPFRFDWFTSFRRRRSTKWRLHTKNIYQIHTTSHCSVLCVHKAAKGVNY